MTASETGETVGLFVQVADGSYCQGDLAASTSSPVAASPVADSKGSSVSMHPSNHRCSWISDWLWIAVGGRLFVMTDNKPNPEVLSLILCDQIITDRITGKQSLIGMFSVIHSVRFPMHQPQLSVYTSLTGGHGTATLMIRIVDVNEERPPLVQGQGQVEFKSPLAIANLALQFHGLRFPQPGDYRVQLLSNGVMLREARLRVVQATPRLRPESGSQDFPPGIDGSDDDPHSSGYGSDVGDEPE